MLPTTQEFDAALADVDGLLARAERAKQQAELALELANRAGRARCLALLELYEQLPRTRRPGRYHEIAVMTGMSISRVQQLLADGRIWRTYERDDDA